MALDFDALTPEERMLAERMTRSTWEGTDGDKGADSYRKRDIDALVDRYEPDTISMPMHRNSLRGHDDVRAYYVKRTGDFEMNAQTEVDAIDIVGDLAIATGTFRACRKPERGVPALEHAGRFLVVYKRGDDGVWRIWRDMDQPSPDADHFYDRLEAGW